MEKAIIRYFQKLFMCSYSEAKSFYEYREKIANDMTMMGLHTDWYADKQKIYNK